MNLSSREFPIWYYLVGFLALFACAASPSKAQSMADEAQKMLSLVTSGHHLANCRWEGAKPTCDIVPDSQLPVAANEAAPAQAPSPAQQQPVASDTGLYPTVCTMRGFFGMNLGTRVVYMPKQPAGAQPDCPLDAASVTSPVQSNVDCSTFLAIGRRTAFAVACRPRWPYGYYPGW